STTFVRTWFTVTSQCTGKSHSSPAGASYDGGIASGIQPSCDAANGADPASALLAAADTVPPASRAETDRATTRNRRTSTPNPLLLLTDSETRQGNACPAGFHCPPPDTRRISLDLGGSRLRYSCGVPRARAAARRPRRAA